MNKIYTSVLCMVLLMPTLARAEICTDFDDNMNIIEFDCSEGAAAARKRIAAEREKVRAAAERQAEQERIAAEKVATTKRQVEEQRKTAERAEREKQRELEREVEKLRLEADPWQFFVGIGAGAFGGDTRREDAFLTDELRNAYEHISIDYYTGGDPHFVLSAGVRRHFINTNWYAQLELAYRTEHEQRLEREIGSPIPMEEWNSSLHISDDMKISRNSIDLSASMGYRMSSNWSVYGKLGVGLTKYKTENWNLRELETDSVNSVNFGFGAEYNLSRRVTLYGEGAAWVGSFPYCDTLLSGTVGARLMF